MSVRYITWAFNQNLKSPMQKLILVKIADNSDDAGYAFPALGTISKFTCANEKTVRRAIKDLESKGLMTVTKMPASSNHKRNTYQLHFEVVLHYEVESHEDVSGLSVPVSGLSVHSHRSQSPDNRQLTVIEPSVNNIDQLFESFWLAGMRKIGKKGSLSAFKAAAKKNGDVDEFTAILINDVQSRNSAKQFGFDKLHPERYLKNERWKDDIQIEADQQSSNGLKMNDTSWINDMEDVL